MTFAFSDLASLAASQVWQVTIVAILVAVLVRVCCQRRPHLAYLLWMLVIVKCVTPPIWSSPTSVFSWASAEHEIVRATGEATVPQPVKARQRLEPVTSATDATPVPATHAPAPLPEAATEHEPIARGGLPEPETQVASAVVPTIRPAESSRLPSLSLRGVLGGLWLVGAIACAALIVTKRFLCAWAVRASSVWADDKLQRQVDDLARELGVRRRVRVLVSRRPFGPAVFGVWQPTVVLPATLLREDRTKHLKPVLAHELIHFRRGDTLVGYLQLAAQVVWWFHPLVWWANREAARERERCCDEEALVGLHCEPGIYAQTLLDVLKQKRELRPLFALPGMRAVEITARRLEHIMSNPRGYHARTPRRYWLLAIASASLLLPGASIVIQASSDRDEPTSSVVAAPAGGVYQWGLTSHRNNVSQEQFIPTHWDVVSGENIKWIAQLGSQTYGTPIVANGKVVIGTNNAAGYVDRLPGEVDLGVLLCFDEQTGEFLWQHSSEKLPTGRVHDWPLQGICSTPYVEGERLWFVSNRGEVVCLDMEGFRDGDNDGPVVDEPSDSASEADVIWKLDMMDELGVSPHHASACSITAHGDLLFVVTAHGVDEAHGAPDPAVPSFIAVDKRSGQVRWSDNSPGQNVLGGQWSSPAFGVLGGVGQVIFPGGDGWLYSFEFAAMKRGETQLLWKFDCNPKEARWTRGSRGTRNHFIAAPVINDGRVYVCVGQSPDTGEGPGHVWCIDPTKRGDISPELVFNESDPATPIPHKRLQACDPAQGDFVAQNPNSGAIWHYAGHDRNNDGKASFDEKMHRSVGSIVIDDGLLFVADFSGLLHCLDAETGHVQWTYDQLAAVWSTPLIVDGKLFVCDEDGEVAIYQVARQPELLAEINMGQAVYSTAVAANGAVYVATKESLVAISADLDETDRPAHRETTQGDWHRFRGGPASTGVSNSTLPEALTLHWDHKLPSPPNELSAVVANDRVFVPDGDGRLYCLDLERGQPLWDFYCEVITTVPLVVEDRVFVGTAEGRFFCIDVEKAKRVWSYAGDAPVVKSATAVGDKVLFCNDAGEVICLRATDGTLMWKTEFGDAVRGSPTVADGRVLIAGCDGLLHVLDLRTGEEVVSIPIDGPTTGTPAVVDGQAFVGTENGSVLGLTLQTAEVAWSTDTAAGVRSSAAVSQGIAVIGSRDKHIYGLKATTGDILWKFAAKRGVDASPVIVGDSVFVGSFDGRLRELSLKTGKPLWEVDLGSELTGSVAVAGGKLLAVAGDGTLYCFGPEQKPATATKRADTPPPVKKTLLFEIEVGESLKLTDQIRIERTGDGLKVKQYRQQANLTTELDGPLRVRIAGDEGGTLIEARRGQITFPATKEGETTLAFTDGVRLLQGETKLEARSLELRLPDGAVVASGIGGASLRLPKATQQATRGDAVVQAQRVQTLTQPNTPPPADTPVVKRAKTGKELTAQLLFGGPAGMKFSLLSNDKTLPAAVAPGRINLKTDQVVRFKLTDIPDRDGLTLFPTVEMAPASPKTEAYLSHNAVPIQITVEDLDQVMAGNFVTKVIFLPDPEFQEMVIAGVEALVSTRLDPGVDPIVEGDARGEILAVLRLGNKDVEPE